MKLIVNADDFGLTPKINEAIVNCMTFGIVKSTTLMINQPGTADALKRIAAKQIPEVGLHLTLSAGRPILPAKEVPDLVDEQGHFLSRNQLHEGEMNIDPEQVYRELKAQFDWAVAHKVPVNHLDTHHFAAVFPNMREAYIRLANETGLPSRRVDVITQGQPGLEVKTPDAFDLNFFDRGVSYAALETLLGHHMATVGDGVLEIMCHPGLEDDDVLPFLSSYIGKRAEETTILTSQRFKVWLAANSIDVIGFDRLAKQ